MNQGQCIIGFNHNGLLVHSDKIKLLVCLCIAGTGKKSFQRSYFIFDQMKVLRLIENKSCQDLLVRLIIILQNPPFFLTRNRTLFGDPSFTPPPHNPSQNVCMKSINIFYFLCFNSDMREANWRNSDQYFHARGNHDAASRGPGGRWAARVIR